MIKCPKCKRVTEKGETTSNFTVFRLEKYGEEKVCKQIDSQIVVCNNCRGEKILK